MSAHSRPVLHNITDGFSICDECARGGRERKRQIEVEKVALGAEAVVSAILN